MELSVTRFAFILCIYPFSTLSCFVLFLLVVVFVLTVAVIVVVLSIWLIVLNLLWRFIRRFTRLLHVFRRIFKCLWLSVCVCVWLSVCVCIRVRLWYNVIHSSFHLVDETICYLVPVRIPVTMTHNNVEWLKVFPCFSHKYFVRSYVINEEIVRNWACYSFIQWR